MIANYGFEDASGLYFISIDTDKCIICKDRGCLDGCPAAVFELGDDDWDDQVAVVKSSARNQITMTCAECKPVSDCERPLPCQKACILGAISHSW